MNLIETERMFHIELSETERKEMLSELQQYHLSLSQQIGKLEALLQGMNLV